MIDESDSPDGIIEIVDIVLLNDVGVLVTRAGGDHPNKVPFLPWLLTVLTVGAEPFSGLDELGLLPNSMIPSSRISLEFISDEVRGGQELMDFESSVTVVEASYLMTVRILIGVGNGGVGVFLMHVFNYQLL